MNKARWAVLAALAAAAAGIQAHPQHETDVFWQMTLGRAVWRHGSRIVPEPVALASFDAHAVVPEWLWGMAAWGIHTLGGHTALSVFAMVGAVAMVVATHAMLRRVSADSQVWVVGLVTASVVAIASERLKVRPQLMTLVFMPLFIAQTYDYVAAPLKRRVRLGAILVLLEVVWAQLHGGFVLAPFVFGLLVAPRLLGAKGNGTQRRIDGLIFAALVLGLGTSAYGIDVAAYVAVHASSDSVRHLVEMQPLTWAYLSPSVSVYGFCYLLMWATSIGGLLYQRRLPLAELLLAMLGGALALSAARFVALGSVLLAPLASIALATPRRPHLVGRVLVVLAGGSAVAAAAWDHHQTYGPLGRLGISPSTMPTAASASLALLPAGAGALTAFDAGPAIGFALDGQVRTFVDGRTPLFFDDTDFAVGRLSFANDELLALAARRFEVTAVVVDRDAACPGVPSRGWKLVAMDPVFNTYMPETSTMAGLTALAACGGNYLADDACADDARLLDADIQRLRDLAPGPFANYLEAERIVRCGGDSGRARDLIPDVNEAWRYRQQRDLLLARWLLNAGREAEAIALLRPAIRDGQVAALRVVWKPMMEGQGVSNADKRAVLEDIVAVQDDEAIRGLLAHLAEICTTTDDSACARFHGVRAAMLGSPRALGTLRWLERHHPSERARRDASRWLEVLSQMPPADSSAPDM